MLQLDLVISGLVKCHKCQGEYGINWNEQHYLKSVYKKQTNACLGTLHHKMFPLHKTHIIMLNTRFNIIY